MTCEMWKQYKWEIIEWTMRIVVIVLFVLLMYGCNAKAATAAGAAATAAAKQSYIVASEHIQDSSGVSLVMVSSSRSIAITDGKRQYEGKLTAKELSALKKLVKKTAKLNSSYTCRNESRNEKSNSEAGDQSRRDYVFTSELKGAKGEIRVTAYGKCLLPKELKAIDSKLASLRKKYTAKAA